MSGKFIIRFVVVLALVCCCFSEASSEEQCVASYDIQTNVVRIPCVTVGDLKIWVNLRLTSVESPQFVVDGFGETFLPLWLTKMISDFESAPVSNPPRRVTQSRYNGNVVYYISAPCCDQFSHLYDVSGTLICSPDGGFAGGGDGRCPDFHAVSSGAVVVWEDRRTK